MSESKEKHRLRMQLKRSHPEWSGEKLKEELSKISGSQKRPKCSQPVHKSSQNIKRNPIIAPPHKGSQGVHKSSLEQRVWLKFDHAVDKSQYVLSESLDGVTWRYVSTLTKNQALERNGLVLVHTWHKGSAKEDDAV